MGREPDSFSPPAAVGGGPPGPGLRGWRAGLPPAVGAGSMWRPGGGDWAGALVSQWLGPTAALPCSAPKPFRGGSGRRPRSPPSRGRESLDLGLCNLLPPRRRCGVE